MSQLTPAQRKYVEARYHYPQLPPYKVLQAIAPTRYVGKYDAARKQAQRMDINPMVQAAMLEYGKTTYASKLPKAIDAIDKIIDNSKAKERVKVLHGLLDRVGMHAVAETKTTVTHEFDREQAIRAIAAILERNQTLLPKIMPVITAGSTVLEGEAPQESDD